MQDYILLLEELDKKLQIAKENFNKAVSEKRKIENEIKRVQKEVLQKIYNKELTTK